MNLDVYSRFKKLLHKGAYVKRDVHLTFNNIQNESRILVGVEVDHVPNGSVCECRTVHGNIVLKQEPR